ncbi:MAG: hypothetical protein J0G32_06780 [Alphaproteobacteria bacterium]|nr:hypothetical protein [Alphaproteobacteria bacterium]OJV12100.1 MAG: hypothetical protein BGO27_05105 [Alphaproteobacteria bacterium 33-17]
MYKNLLDLINQNKIEEAKKLYKSLTIEQKMQLLIDTASIQNIKLAKFIKDSIEQEDEIHLAHYAQLFLKESTQKNSRYIKFLTNHILCDQIIQVIKRMCLDSENQFARITNLNQQIFPT